MLDASDEQIKALARCEGMRNKNQRTKCEEEVNKKFPPKPATRAIIKPIIYALIALIIFGILFFLVWRFADRPGKKKN